MKRLLLLGMSLVSLLSIQAKASDSAAYLIQGGEKGVELFTKTGTVEGAIHSNQDIYSKGNVSTEALTVVRKIKFKGKLSATSQKEKSQKKAVPKIFPELIDQYFNNGKDYDKKGLTLTSKKTITGANYYGKKITSACTKSLDLKSNIATKEKIHLTATKDISILADVVMSEKSDITIKGKDRLVISGLLYAPNGTVKLEAKEIVVTGQIIAKKVEIKGNTVKLSSSEKQEIPMGSLLLTGMVQERKLYLAWEEETPNPLEEEQQESYEVALSEDGKVFTTTNTATPLYYQDVAASKSEKLYVKVSKRVNSKITSVSDTLEIQLDKVDEQLDTDQDGLPDAYEWDILGTNPLAKDSDGNGILDGEEDNDDDGLTNSQEYQHKSDPTNKDTDGDGLTDGEERNRYQTDPLKVDTDQDGVSDYDEIILGLDPLKKDTNNNGILDNEEKIKQQVEVPINTETRKEVEKVAVEFTAAGNIEHVTSIIDVGETDKLSAGVVGLIGSPQSITTSADFEEATITFTYNPQALGTTEAKNLAVLWYDEENNWYQILDNDTVIDLEKHTVSVKTTHFSTYMLVDKEAWYNTWRENINYRTNDQQEAVYYDFSFVVDVSGSMSGTGLQNAKKALVGFVDALLEKDRASLVPFESTAKLAAPFGSSKGELLTEINKLYTRGGTDVNAGLSESLKHYQESGSKNEKSLVLICDGDVNYQQATIDKAKQMGIKIYAVNVGSRSASVYLEKMAAETKGEYYYCPTVADIEAVFAEVREDSVEKLDTTDTDGDGLYDVYETIGFRSSNGQIIKTDPKKKDTDSDGLTDYEEVGFIYGMDVAGLETLVTEKYIGKGQTVETNFVMLYSDPTKEDTDSDGLSDYDDPYPWKQNAKTITLFRAERSKHNEADGTLANDLKYNDKTDQELLKLNKMFKHEIQFDQKNGGAAGLFTSFEYFTDTFVLGDAEMKPVIRGLIDSFKKGKGKDYSNRYLTEKAQNHDNTQKFIAGAETYIQEQLKKSKGDSEILNYQNYLHINSEDRPTDDLPDLAFNKKADIFNGLTICVNDVWSRNIYLEDFKATGDSYQGKMRVVLYDHFGLDEPDVDPQKKWLFSQMAGFRQWFYLQHHTKYKGAYQPLTTIMEFTIPIAGTF